MENMSADDNQSRKYVLWFGSKSRPSAEELAQKARCKNFWEFVDSNPNLQAMIKKGEPISAKELEKNQNIGNIKVVVKDKVKNEIKVKNSALTRPDYDDHEDRRKIEEAKGILLLARRQEQRTRIAKQREKTLELERKSGQIRPKAAGTKEKKPPSVKVLSDVSEGREYAIMTAYQEMTAYDEVKNVHEKPPKSKSNTISQITELDSDQEESASKILGNGNGLAEIEEIFLKNSGKNSTE